MSNPRPFRRSSTAVPLVAVGAVVIGLIVARAQAVLEANDPVTLALCLIGLGGLAILGWRVALVARYRPRPAPADDELPSVTVIVPAFNEGRQVYDTVASIAASRYPAGRLQIIAVDDGSDDDTGLWIARAARDFGSQAIFCPVNRGKRHALYCGFGEARGEVIVTVDSDSEVLTDTLKNLVAPLVYDANVGAVAGVVRVLNRKGPIPAMLDVSFTYAFDFIRASESVLGAVVCCPGALSAYRRSLIDEVKDEWMEQTVFGRPANIGEDRALTNQVLRRGLRVELQSTALVFTKVPTRFRGLWKMLLRWARSNARETFMLGRFVFRRFRRDHLTAIRLLFTHHALTMLVAGILFPCTLVAVALQPSILLWIALTSLLVATVPAAVYATRRQPQNCLWGFAYGLLSAFATSWITPWALITPHRTGWLTRGPGRPLKQPRGLTAA